MRWLLLVVMFFLLWGQASLRADTMYVTDRLYLSLRSTPDSEGPSLAVLCSDNQVEVLETEGDWVRVSVKNGQTGWVMKKYLVKDLPRSLFIEELEGQIKNQSATIEDLRGQMSDMSLTIKGLEEKLESKSLALQELERETRENPVRVETSDVENQDLARIAKNLREENASLRREVSELSVLRERGVAMKREIEGLKKRVLDSQSMAPETSVKTSHLIKKGTLYAVGIVAVLAGFVIGYMAKRPNKNRYYLK
jgi:SH3 domain protein